jgi:hypothetical protein
MSTSRFWRDANDRNPYPVFRNWVNAPADLGVKLSAGWCPAAGGVGYDFASVTASRRPQVAPAEQLVSRGGRRAASFLARETRRSLHQGG